MFHKSIKKILSSIKRNCIDNEVLKLFFVITLINIFSVALFQDYLGKEKYLNLVNNHWFDIGKYGWIIWAVFILILTIVLYKIFATYINEKEENKLFKKFISISHKDTLKEFESNKNKGKKHE
jgi:uncharacterized BrkB/YihY/UPF0761 family membrane protein